MAARSGDGESCALLLMSLLAFVCGKVPRAFMPCACDALFCFCRPSSPKPKCAGGCPADIEAVCAAWIRGQIFCISRDLVFIIHVAVRLNERQHPCMQISFTANVYNNFTFLLQTFLSRLSALDVRASGRVEALPAGFRARRQCLIVLQKRSLLGRAHGVAAQEVTRFSSNSTQRHGGVQRVKLHA